MTYAEKLKDPRWQKKRLEVLNRDNFTCIYCYDQKECLHVHHKSYIKGKQPWEYDLENLTTACESCHTLIETIKKLGYTEIISIEKFIYDGYYDLYCTLRSQDMFVYRKFIVSKKFVYVHFIPLEALYLYNCAVKPTYIESETQEGIYG